MYSIFIYLEKKCFCALGGGDEALDDLLAVEQSLEQAQKENRQMEKDIERERLLKEDLQKKINLLNVENEQLQRDVESLRDEMENIRYWLLKFDILYSSYSYRP